MVVRGGRKNTSSQMLGTWRNHSRDCKRAQKEAGSMYEEEVWRLPIYFLTIQYICACSEPTVTRGRHKEHGTQRLCLHVPPWGDERHPCPAQFHLVTSSIVMPSQKHMHHSKSKFLINISPLRSFWIRNFGWSGEGTASKLCVNKSFR